MIGLGYLHLGTFSKLRKFPCCLTQGCLEDTVEALRSRCDIRNLATRKRVMLLGCGVSTQSIVDILRLAQDLSSSVQMLEKGYDIGSGLANNHCQYLLSTLALRCAVSQPRSLFNLTVDERMELGLRSRIENVSTSSVRHSARMSFVRASLRKHPAAFSLPARPCGQSICKHFR